MFPYYNKFSIICLSKLAIVIDETFMTSAKKPKVRLDNQLCFALYAASNAVEQHYKPHLKSQNLTYTPYLVLMALFEQDEISISALAERLEVTRATMTPIVRRLETMGLLIRDTQKGDERQKILSLTKQGREIWIESCDASSRVFDHTGLTKAEADELIRICGKISRKGIESQ